VNVGQTLNGKTLIGILASHDSPDKNNALARLLESLRKENKDRLSNFHFLFTGGTYERIIIGTNKAREEGITPVDDETKRFFTPRSTSLPSRISGGVTVLAYTVVQRFCNIIWAFLTPTTSHWLNPENLALMRLSDQWHVKRFMNSGSVIEWFRQEADLDKDRNPQVVPMELKLPGTQFNISSELRPEGGYVISKPSTIDVPKTVEQMTIALIAHDDMKTRMIEFALDYETELARFNCILATGTTGRDVGDAASSLKEGEKIYRYHSGPKGGDIEIATEILFGRCHVVVFFIDPLRPHPHIEDIRVVFGACMIQDQVRMLTNEMQSREWMERVVKRGIRLQGE
jgi:methylglyoxal synthase